MSIHVACPVCRAALKYVLPPASLACPFCRTDLKLNDRNIPVGKVFRCGKCRGVFTADAPPPGLLVCADSHVDCPRCHVTLKLPENFGPGKFLRCPRCTLTFDPAAKPHVLPPAQTTEALPDRFEPFPEVPPTATVATEAPSPASLPLPPPAPLAEEAEGEIDIFARLLEAPAPPAPAPALPEPKGENGSTADVAPPPGIDAPTPQPAFVARRGNKPASQTHLVLSKPASKTHLELAPPEPPPAEASTPDEAPPEPAPLADSSADEDALLSPPAPAEPEPAPEADEEEPPAPSAPRQRALARRQEAISPARALADVPVLLPDTQKIFLPPHHAAPAAPAPKRGAARKAPAPSRRPVVPVEPEPDPVEAEPEPAPIAVAPPPAAPKPAAPRPIPAPPEPEPEPWMAPRPVAPAPRPMPQPAPSRPLPAKKSSVAADEEKTSWKKLVLISLVVTAVLYAGYSLFTGSWGSRRRTTYVTEGVVMYLGKPAVGARVTLFPETKGKDRYYPTGKVGPDGSFKLTTYSQDDGAPEGRYKVTIVRGVIEGDEWAEMNQKMSQEEVQRVVKERARDPLMEKYSDPERSGLTAEVTSQAPNKLKTFELQ
jgi:hypothetical protein